MDITYNKVDETALPISVNRVSASEYNQIAASLMNIINTSGVTPDVADNAQLLNALKAMGSGWAMPSGTYDELTKGAHGTTYTAPANGYFYSQGHAGSGAYVSLLNQTKGFGVSAPTGSNSSSVFCLCPAQKGDVVATYFYGGSLSVLKFIYAEGSTSEES